MSKHRRTTRLLLSSCVLGGLALLTSPIASARIVHQLAGAPFGAFTLPALESERRLVMCMW